MSSGYQKPELKKEEYRKYLNRSGVVNALTKVLVGLYEEPERPPNAVDYIKRYMAAEGKGDAAALREEVSNLKEELEHCKGLIRTLTEDNDDLKHQLEEA